MAEPSTPPVDRPEVAEAQLSAVLREGGEIALGVRLRIALDVLESAAEDGIELAARTAGSRFRLENVRVHEDGTTSVTGDGTTDGVAELLWEIVAGQDVGDGPPQPIGEAADDVIEGVAEVVTAALGKGETRMSTRELADAFEQAGRGYLDTHEDVRHALGLDRTETESVAVSIAPSSAAPTSVPTSTSAPAPTSVPAPVSVPASVSPPSSATRAKAASTEGGPAASDDDASGPRKEAAIAQKDGTGHQKDETGPRKDETGLQEDETGPQKEATGPKKEATGPKKEATGSDKEEKGPQKEGTSPNEEETATAKGETPPKKDDSATSPGDLSAQDQGSAENKPATSVAPVSSLARPAVPPRPSATPSKPRIAPAAALSALKTNSEGLPRLDGDDDMEPTVLREEPTLLREATIDALLEGWEPPDSRPLPRSGPTSSVASTSPRSGAPIASSPPRSGVPLASSPPISGVPVSIPPSGRSGLPALHHDMDDPETLDEPTQVVGSARRKASGGRPEHVLAPGASRRDAPASSRVVGFGASAAATRVEDRDSDPIISLEALPKLDDDEDDEDVELDEEELTRRMKREDAPMLFRAKMQARAALLGTPEPVAPAPASAPALEAPPAERVEAAGPVSAPKDVAAASPPPMPQAVGEAAAPAAAAADELGVEAASSGAAAGASPVAEEVGASAAGAPAEAASPGESAPEPPKADEATKPTADADAGAAAEPAVAASPAEATRDEAEEGERAPAKDEDEEADEDEGEDDEDEEEDDEDSEDDDDAAAREPAANDGRSPFAAESRRPLAPRSKQRRERVFVLVLAAMCIAAIGIAAFTALRADKPAPGETVDPARR